MQIEIRDTYIATHISELYGLFHNYFISFYRIFHLIIPSFLRLINWINKTIFSLLFVLYSNVQFQLNRTHSLSTFVLIEFATLSICISFEAHTIFVSQIHSYFVCNKKSLITKCVLFLSFFPPSSFRQLDHPMIRIVMKWLRQQQQQH